MPALACSICGYFSNAPNPLSCRLGSKEMIFLFIADLCNLKFHIGKAVFFLVCIQGVFQGFCFLLQHAKVLHAQK